MLFVKIKNTTETVTTFEILSRSPLNYIELDLEKYTFKELFAPSNDDMINTNISNYKNDIYKCIDKTFISKLDYWNQNILKITPIYVSIYEMEKSVSGNIYEMEEYRESYMNTFGGDIFTFNKDFKFFRELFNTARNAYYGKGDFMHDYCREDIGAESI